PARIDRTTGRTSPRSPEDAGLCRASRPATWDRRRRWCGSRRTGHLNVRLTGLAEEREFIRPEIRIVPFGVGIAANVTRPRRRKRQKVHSERALVRGAVRPERASCVPTCAEPFVVRDRVLNDESFHALR